MMTMTYLWDPYDWFDNTSMSLYLAGCDFFFDGLVCWPSTPTGEEAGVNCWSIEAFARALGQNNKTGSHGKMVIFFLQYIGWWQVFPLKKGYPFMLSVCLDIIFSFLLCFWQVVQNLFWWLPLSPTVTLTFNVPQSKPRHFF